MKNSMARHRSTNPAVSEPSLWAEIWEIARIPAILALLAIGVTWAVWYYTTEPGQLESARPAGCDLWGSPEKCISLNVLNKMFTHGAIAGGTGGIYFYVMLRREREARQAAERRAERAEWRADRLERRADRAERMAEQRAARAEQLAEQAERQAAAERQQLINRILELTAPSGNGQEQTPSE